MPTHKPQIRGFTSWAITIAAACVAVVCAEVGLLRLIENEQRAVVSSLINREASGQVHIVEIDAQSLEQAQQYPLPRETYARVVKQLDDAGARSIVFDINFSSRSTEEDDAAFARAIREAQALIVLPTFRQAASEMSTDQLDILPIPELREHSNLASVSVLPDADSRVRRMVYGTVTMGVPRPSLSAQIAGVSGAINTSFPIDFAIDPSSIPRHSLTSVAAGQFDEGSVAGKDILVGATAIDLGDRYGTPNHGIIPGVVVQALAAETLLAGAFREWGWIPLLVLSAALGMLVSRAPTYARLILYTAASLAVILIVQASLLHGARIAAEAVPGVLTIALIAAAHAASLARAAMRQSALVDSDTGFPNALAYARRPASNSGFIVVARIRDFDAILSVVGRDNIGKVFQAVADELAVSHGIREVFRSDTRMIAWEYDGEYQDLIDMFDQLNEMLMKPINLSGSRVDVALTFGFASSPELSAAARASSLAADERKLWHAHEDAEAAIIEQRVSLMGELDEAIEAGQLLVLYQPKLRLRTNEIESVEALVRWNHPTRGYMRPDLFIPLAEETNRIEAMTLFVLQQTIVDLRNWGEQGIVVSAAVNISANLISSEKFVSAAQAIVSRAGVPKNRLIFEVTESAAMQDQNVAGSNLRRFRELGVEVSMDDYGTGQSTLSYIQSLPLTELKIDRAFVQHAHIERSDALLVKSTVQLGHSLGLKVVCEGIEDPKCLDFVREVGADYAQGYLISKPLMPGELIELLSQSREQEQRQEV